MSKGAIVLSAVPSVIGGTLGQIVEHAQDKNIIIYCGTGTGGTAVVSNLAISNHTHGSAPTMIGPVTVVSSSNAWTISVSNYITTGALSNHTHGSISTVSFAGSNVTYSSASSGMTLSIPNFLTTAALSNHSHTNYAGTGTTVTGANVTLNSNGLILDITGGGGAADGFNILAAGTQTAASNTTVLFSNSNGVSFGMSGNSRITASYSQSTHDHPYISTANSTLFQSVGAYLTTARASTDAIGLVTAATNVTWTADSRGLSIDAGGYAGTTTAGTNVGLTVNSLGIRASIDTAGLTALGDGVNIIAVPGTTAATNETVIFSNSNGVSFGLHSDGSVLTASHNAFSTSSQLTATFMNTSAAHIRQIAASNSSYTSGSVQISGSNNITVTYNASTILISGANTHAQQTGISAIGVSDTTYSAGSVSFVNGNNISFGSSGANEISASISFPAQTQQGMYYSASGVESSSNTIQFANGSGVSFHISNGSVAATVKTDYQTAGAYLTSQSNQGVSGSNGSFAFQTLGVLGSGVADVYTTAGDSLVVSVPAQTSEPRVVSLNGTSGSLSLSGASNITVSALNGSTITIYGPSNILNSFSVGGNTGTTGSSAISGGGFVLAGGSNITLSQSNNTISIHGTGGIRLGASDTTYLTGTVMISAGSNITVGTTENAGIQYIKIDANISGTAAGDGYNIIAAGSQTASTAATVVMSDANGITFGLSDNTITGSVKTDYAGTGTTITGGSVTLDTAGMVLNIPQGSLYYVDSNGVSFGASSSGLSTTITASVSITAGLAAMNYSASGTSSSSGTLQFASSNGVGFSLVSGSVVGTVRTNYMSSASSSVFARTGYTSTTQAGTVIGGTLNTNGLSIAVPAMLTTAMQSGASVSFARTGFSTATTAGTLIDGVLNTAGLSLNVPRFITTALASNAGTAFIGINTAGTNITWTVNSSGISINAGNYARTGITTNSTSGSLLVGTLNTGGLNLGVPAYLTTAIGATYSSLLAHTGFTTGTTGGSNIAGTLDTAGLSLRVPNYVTGSNSLLFNDSNGISWGSAVAGSTTTITASHDGVRLIRLSGNTSGTTVSISSGTLTLAGGSNITLQQSGNIISIHGASGSGGGNITFSAGSSSGSLGSVVFSNSNNVSFGLAGSTITADIPVGSVNFSDSNGISFGSAVSGVSTTITAQYEITTIDGTINVPNSIDIVLTAPSGTNGTDAGSIFLSADGIPGLIASRLYTSISTAGATTTNFSSYSTASIQARHDNGIYLNNGYYIANFINGSSTSNRSYGNIGLTFNPIGQFDLIANQYNTLGSSSISAGILFSPYYGLIYNDSASSLSSSWSSENGWIPNKLYVDNRVSGAGIWQISQSGGSTAGTSSSNFGSVLRIVAGAGITLSGGSGGITVIA